MTMMVTRIWLWLWECGWDGRCAYACMDMDWVWMRISTAVAVHGLFGVQVFLDGFRHCFWCLVVLGCLIDPLARAFLLIFFPCFCLDGWCSLLKSACIYWGRRWRTYLR